MGCIPDKEKRKLKALKALPNIENEEKQEQKHNKMELCSTTISNSNKTIGELWKKVSSMHGTDLADRRKKKWEGMGNICGPGPNSEMQQLKCWGEMADMYLQLVHGFPSENIMWIEKNQSSQTNSSFILQSNVNIFARFQIECQECLKKEISTSCKTTFTFPHVSCSCSSTELFITLLSLSPPLACLWADNISTPLKVRVPTFFDTNSTLRVIGCTSCWKFEKLKRRNDCGCSVCQKCAKNDNKCEVCH